MPPAISILLPNLNNRPYLEERIRSIQEQTFSDWELIVVDSYSDDGAWEYFQACAQTEKRIKIYRSPERGIYNNFNKCIRLARGKYIYIATSDDAMTPNALEVMVQALEENPGCDIAHCKLSIINENNDPLDAKTWDNFFIVRYFGDLIDKKHIRKAPHDGVLHFCGITVYTSLTQLLIKRSLFDRIGLFLENYGSQADYEWVMRATLTADTVHIPQYLATWRCHGNQATSENSANRAKASGKFLKMSGHALKIAREKNPALIRPLNIKKLRYILAKEKLYYQHKNCQTKFSKYGILMKWFFMNPILLYEFIETQKKGSDFISQTGFLAYIKRMVSDHHLEKNLINVEI